MSNEAICKIIPFTRVGCQGCARGPLRAFGLNGCARGSEAPRGPPLPPPHFGDPAAWRGPCVCARRCWRLSFRGGAFRGAGMARPEGAAIPRSGWTITGIACIGSSASEVVPDVSVASPAGQRGENGRAGRVICGDVPITTRRRRLRRRRPRRRRPRPAARLPGSSPPAGSPVAGQSRWPTRSNPQSTAPAPPRPLPRHR